YGDPQNEDPALVAPVQPYRMNERLTVQQGLFLCPNKILLGFSRCLRNLLLHAKKRNMPSAEWLHKFEVAPGARLDVLGALNNMNINSATLYPGLDGFSRSLYANAEIQNREDWPGVPKLGRGRRWVTGE